MSKYKGRKGFTLIEVVVIIAILGVLASISIPRYSGFNELTRVAVDQATVRTLNSVTPISRINIAKDDPFEDKSKTDEQLIDFLVDGGYLIASVEAQSKDATFKWRNDDERWYIMVGSSFHILSLSDGLNLSGVMLGSWGGIFGEAETYKGSSKSIVIPVTINGSIIENIGRHAFREVGLISVAFENESRIKRIHTDAFRGNLLGEILLPETLERIDMRAFQDNNLKVVKLPESLSIIEQRAFHGNNLEKITIGTGVSIGERAFGENTVQFIQAYQNGGSGTYIFNGTIWTREGD